jgi:hypothetical protein
LERPHAKTPRRQEEAVETLPETWQLLYWRRIEEVAPTTTEKADMKKQKFPPGWDENRVKKVIAHYENQTEDQEHAEIEEVLKVENVAICNTLSNANIDTIIAAFTMSAEKLGNSIANLKGLKLLQSLKREKVGDGPYPRVTLFEAANRIMSDLVILHGVKWLLNHDVFPFDSYTVEYGNEDKNGFDIRASNASGQRLIGEAFNVAESFFHGKKSAMLKKLRHPAETAEFKIILVNHDAINATYGPKLQPREFLIVVDIGLGVARMVPGIMMEAVV